MNKPEDRKIRIFQLIFLAVFTFLLYFPSIKGQFIWDDGVQVVRNEFVKDWSSCGKIFVTDLGAGANTPTPFYRPLPLFLHLVNYQLSGLDVRGFHLVNIFLHILAGILVYLFLLELFKDSLIAFFAAFLFLVHPVQVESVAWISAGAEILAAIGILGCLILYLRWSFSKGVREYLLLALLYAFALLSKENSLLLLPLIVLIQFLFGVKAKKGAFFTLGAVICAWAALRVFLVHSQWDSPPLATLLFRNFSAFFASGAESRL